jgi:hypothetical protein
MVPFSEQLGRTTYHQTVKKYFARVTKTGINPKLTRNTSKTCQISLLETFRLADCRHCTLRGTSSSTTRNATTAWRAGNRKNAEKLN